MKTIKESIYLLYSTHFRESDLIVNLLSPDEGKLTARIYGGKKIGKNKSFFYHPGDLLTLEYQKKENNDFIKVISISTKQLIKVDSMPYDQFIFHSYLLELIGRIAKPGSSAEEFYQIIERNNKMAWVYPYKLPFILWSLWAINNSCGYAIDYNCCCACGRPTWQNRGDRVTFRKENYHLLKDSAQLICAQCKKSADTSTLFSGSTIKVFWLLENTDDFWQQNLKIPSTLMIVLIQKLNDHILHSQNLKPNSLEMFVSSLEKY